MSLSIFLQSGSFAETLPYIILMFGIMYFFMVRPQMQRQKKEKQFRTALKKGDKIVTTSGIHGKIVEFNDKDNTCTIETGAGKIKFERSAISLELSKRYLKPIAKK